MNIETNEMFWDKLKNILKEAFSKKEEVVEEPQEIEPTNIELEEQPQAEPTPEPQPTVEEPKVEEPVVEEPKVEEPKPQEEPKQEEAPKENVADVAKLEELIGNLRQEIEALKNMNSGLEDKIKDLGKQPSAEPIKPNGKPSASNTYSAWREQMREMLR